MIHIHTESFGSVWALQPGRPARDRQRRGPIRVRLTRVLLIATSLVGLGAASALACSEDADCNDNLACTGVETCDAGVCVAGTPVDCTGFADQCNTATCTEPTGTCATTPVIDGFGCDDGDHCSGLDICRNGECVGTDGQDSDDDGYCDTDEVQADCDPHDARLIPAQPSTYSGGANNTPGEILMTYYSPMRVQVLPSSDVSCAVSGLCNATTHFCQSGKIDDPCADDDDCDQPPLTCRIVINYAAVADLMLTDATLKLRGKPIQSLMSQFTPATPGCSRKVDITLPAGFRRATVRLKAGGTTSNRNRRDRDRIRYRE